MGYTIHYVKNPKKKKKRTMGLLLIFLASVLLLAVFRQEVGMLLLPGDPQVTQMALEVFAQKIAEGEGVSQAFAYFCAVVLEGSYYG